jgi:DNA-binding transcriptional LysR family regulator
MTTHMNETYAFVAVVRAGSFTQAGKNLGVPKSTLSKQVTRLEERLGARLLQRTTRKLSLTDTGEAYFSRCRQAIEDIEEAERVAADVAGRVTGKLRVAATAGMGAFFGPSLPELHQRYPELEIELVLGAQQHDLIAEGIDVALRGAPELEGNYIARRVVADRFRFYASPAYLEARGAPGSIEELEGHDFIGHNFMASADIPISSGDGDRTVRLKPWLTANDFNGLMHTVAAGGGITLLLEQLARAWVETGELAPVLEDVSMPGGYLWVIYPSKHHLSPKVRVFVDFIVELVERAGGALLMHR